MKGLVSCFVSALVVTAAVPASAQGIKECGEPPVVQPSIPSGSALTAQKIREARDTVVAYSQSVDVYLQCMDDRFSLLATYMTEDQRTQYNNDLASLHDGRRELQLKMNEAIRAFRAQASAGR